MNPTPPPTESSQSGNGVNSQKRDHRQEVTDSIVRLLEEGVAPWQNLGRASAFPSTRQRKGRTEAGMRFICWLLLSRAVTTTLAG